MHVAARLFFRRRATPSRMAFAMFVRRLLAASKRISSVVEVEGRAAGGVTASPRRAGARGCREREEAAVRAPSGAEDGLGFVGHCGAGPLLDRGGRQVGDLNEAADVRGSASVFRPAVDVHAHGAGRGEAGSPSANRAAERHLGEVRGLRVAAVVVDAVDLADQLEEVRHQGNGDADGVRPRVRQVVAGGPGVRERRGRADVPVELVGRLERHPAGV